MIPVADVVKILGEAADLLGEHKDLIALVIDAIEGHGVSKESIKQVIEAEMLKGSDSEMKREFPDG